MDDTGSAENVSSGSIPVLGMFYDWQNPILVLVPGTLVGLWAQTRLQSAYARYRSLHLATNVSDAEAAREILDQNDLTNVAVHEYDIGGRLTNHYDPTSRA